MRKALMISAAALSLAVAGCSDNKEATAEGGTSEPIAAVAAPAGKSWSTEVRKTEAGGIVMGNPDAPIKVVEFMSITCSHCADFAAQAFETIRDKYVESGRVSFEIRNFVRDPMDLTASILTRCGGEAPFFALTEQALANQKAMFENAQAMGEAQYNQILQMPNETKLVAMGDALGLASFFRQRGISADQAKACLSDVKAIEALVKQTETATKEYNIAGTPSFLINGSTVEFAGWPQLESRIQAMGAR